jgi:hypothetical protein
VNLSANEECTDEHLETLVSRCNKITALDVSGQFQYKIISVHFVSGIPLLTNNAITVELGDKELFGHPKIVP